MFSQLSGLVAVAMAIRGRLTAALGRCREVLARKAHQWRDVLKIGRTHLADAVPLRLGQEIGGLARQLQQSVQPVHPRGQQQRQSNREQGAISDDAGKRARATC